MAEVVLDVKVNTGASTNALKEARNEIKQLTAAALEAEKAGDKALSDTYAKKAAEARDQVKDLQEKINALDPGAKAQAFAAFGQTVAGGLTAAISATALFGDKNKDLEATLVKVQSATALLQATQSIADGLKQASIIKTVALTTAQSAYATVVGGTTGALKLFRIALASTGIGLVTVALGALKANFEKVKQAINSFLDTLKDIPLIGKFIGAVQSGASKVLNWVTSSDAANDSQKELNKTLDDSTQKTDKYNDSISKVDEQTKTYVSGSLNDYNNRLTRLREELNNLVIGSDAFLAKQREIAATEAELKRLTTTPAPPPEATTAKVGKTEEEAAQERQKIEEDERKKREEKQKQDIQAEQDRLNRINAFKIQSTQDTLSAIQKLTEAFQGKSNASARRVFAINKAVSIAQATIDTVLSAQSAYKSQFNPIADVTSPVRGAIAAGIALASGLARVAVIQKQKFEGGGGSVSSAGAGGGGGGSISAPTAPTVPTFNPQGTIIPQGQEQGQQPIKAYVLEDDISTSQNRITDIKTKALYG